MYYNADTAAKYVISTITGSNQARLKTSILPDKSKMDGVAIRHQQILHPEISVTR